MAGAMWRNHRRGAGSEPVGGVALGTMQPINVFVLPFHSKPPKNLLFMSMMDRIRCGRQWQGVLKVHER